MKQPGYSEIKRRVRKFIFRHRMISPGDCIAVGVSGGKDSTFLLHTLAVFREEFRWPFNIKAYRVLDPTSPCFNDSDIDRFAGWCKSLDVELTVVEPELSDRESDSNSLSPCFKCSWRRKEALFKKIHSDGLKTVAIGHTGFDLAVTAVMNMMFHGHLETMPPVMRFFSGEIIVIRPLSVVTENQVIRQHRRLKLPEPPPACDDLIGAARANAEKRVREMCHENPHALYNILKAAERWPADVMNNDP